MTQHSEVVSDVLWTEKYRPKTIDEMALTDENRQVLTSYIESGEIPHLLLVGPPGSGKTTIARILVRALDCTCLPMNASSERGIDAVRGKIGSFAQALTHAKWNIVFLDEFDQMTSDAQTSLRNMMESYAERTRFLLTGNYEHRIIAPIQSRCMKLTFGRPPIAERAKTLLRILGAEKIKCNPSVAFDYANRFPDLRAMLWAAQKALLSKGGNVEELPSAAEAGPMNGEQLFHALVQKDFRTFRSLTTLEADTVQSLRDLFYAIPDNHPQAARLRRIIGQGLHESGFTPDPIVLFLATVSSAMEDPNG